MAKKIIFLYAELTPYFIGCLNNYSKLNKSNLIKVVYLDMFKNLKIDNRHYELIPKNNFKSKNELLIFCKNFSPNLIVTSGRMDKDYLYVAKKLKKSSISVTAQDTLYTNSFKQIFIKTFSNFLYKRYFDKFWGIGYLQTKFALDIGYKEKDIKEGFYVADKKFFDNSSIFEFNNNSLKILFIGRLVSEKNIINLVHAVKSVNKSYNLNNKLVIVGEGKLKEDILKYECVQYEGLKNQDEIINIAKKCDVFCLPSIYEPWGVVTHEMSALGMPILISNRCGSAHELVKDKFNGFKFNPYKLEEIEKAILSFSRLNIKTKRKFSENSIKLSKKINHKLWSSNLNSFLIQ